MARKGQGLTPGFSLSPRRDGGLGSSNRPFSSLIRTPVATRTALWSETENFKCSQDTILFGWKRLRGICPLTLKSATPLSCSIVPSPGQGGQSSRLRELPVGACGDLPGDTSPEFLVSSKRLLFHLLYESAPGRDVLFAEIPSERRRPSDGAWLARIAEVLSNEMYRDTFRSHYRARSMR
jgi:hypothetical protein